MCRFVQKPWGHETIWAHTEQYVGKVLHIKAGHALSVQYHEQKDETIHLLSGEMIYRVGAAGQQEMQEIDTQGRRELPQHAGHRASDGGRHRL
jgi:mannose-6-phosphate isomerase